MTHTDAQPVPSLAERLESSDLDPSDADRREQMIQHTVECLASLDDLGQAQLLASAADDAFRAERRRNHALRAEIDQLRAELARRSA